MGSVLLPSRPPRRRSPEPEPGGAVGSSRPDAAAALVASLARQGLGVPAPTPHGPMSQGPATTAGPGCAVLRWAASGAMRLTGRPEGPPLWPAGDVTGRLDAAAQLLAAIAGALGAEVTVDVGELLAGRAAARRWTRRGATSAGGHCRLLRAVDGWVAVSLARPTDVDLVPALVGAVGGDSAGPRGAAGSHTTDVAHGVGADAGAWDRLARYARLVPAAGLAARAQLLGLPAGRVPGRRPRPAAPWSVTTLGAPSPRRAGRPLVVDLSAMWAGPLCAHLLGRAGARVVKVEDAARPDAARWGDPGLFETLHRGHEMVTVPFTTPAGRAVLHDLVGGADVVIEASRPRALGALGLSPAGFCAARPGRTWISITGYGRAGTRGNRVAFGDDAAAAGGLVARDPGGPVFCGDAVADPVSGLYAAVAALASIAGGGGHLVDCAMTVAAAYANTGPGCAGHHRVEPTAAGWTVSHGEAAVDVPDPPWA